MSRRLGLDVLHLRPTPRFGHAEYCSHGKLRECIRTQTGLSLEDAWECDLIWHTNDGPAEWSERGRTTDMGHAEFLADASDRRPAKASPFRHVDEVLGFDAVAEYGLDDLDALTAHYEAVYQAGCRDFPNQVFTGGCYKTMMSGAIETFGWDMLLQAAADQDAFERVLDSYFRLSLHHCRAWARTSIEAFICHDDMVWTQGPFMAPAFYRRVIFPRYAELFRVLRSAGKKVLYCSDGDWSLFLDDVAAAGADGFIIESPAAIAAAAAVYGKSHVLVGGVTDCRTLTFGTRDQIRAEVEATATLARECPGFFAAVGNHIPGNVPIESALYYFECLQSRWVRGG